MPEKKKPTRKIRVALGCLLSVFLVVVVFYQPIVFGLVRIVAGQFAKSQGIELDFQIGGSLFSDLFVEKLHLRPYPENKVLPLERVDAERIAARFNPLNLLRKEYLKVVEGLELKNIDVIVRPAPPPPEEQKPAAPIRFPAVLPKQIDVENFNLTVKNGAGDLQLKNFELRFRQKKPGYLACESLRIPGTGVWSSLRAELSYTQNQLTLSDFALAPLLTVNRLQLDLARSEQGIFHLGMDAKALGASVLANAAYEQLPDGQDLEANLKITHFELAELQRLVPVALTGSVPQIEVELKGDITRPRSLSGHVAVGAERLHYQNISVDEASATLRMSNGAGTISESVRAGPNRMRADATFLLGESLDSLVQKTAANIGLAAYLPDPGNEIPGLKASTTLLGSIGLADGKAKAVLQTFVTGIGLARELPGFAVSAVKGEVFAVANLPLANDLWSSVAAIALASVDQVSYQDAQVAEIRAETDLVNGSTATGKVSVRSGESRINLSAVAPLPLASEGFNPEKVAGHLTFKLNSITDFVRQELIKGSLSANGDLRIVGGQASGVIRAEGSQLSYKGINVQTLELDTVLKDGEADVQKFQITLNPENSVQFSGSARMNDPFPFRVQGKLAFKELAVLNEILRNFGMRPGIAGELSAEFAGAGDIHRPTGQLEVMSPGLSYRDFAVQSIEIGTAIKDSIATVQRCRISLDPNNYVSLTGTVHVDEPHAFQGNAQIRLPELARFNELLKALGQPAELSGAFNLNLSAGGDAKNPSASLQAQGDQIKYRGLPIDSIRAEAFVQDTRVRLESCRIALDANNHVDLRGACGFIEPFPYEASLTIALNELGVLNDLLGTLGQPQNLTGVLKGALTAHGNRENPDADIHVTGERIKFRGLSVLRTDLDVALKQAKAILKTCRVTLDQSNSIDLSGDIGLGEPNPYMMNGTVTLNNLGAFDGLLESFGQPAGLAGALKVSLAGQGEIKNPAAQLKVYGTGLKYRGILVQTTELESTIKDWLADIHTCRLTLDANNFLDLTGQAGLKSPNTYVTAGKIELNDLAVFDQLLKSLGQSGVVGGDLHIKWSGKGDLATVFPDARLQVFGKNIRYRGLSIQNIDLAGDLLERKLDLPSCKVVFNEKNFIDAGGDARLEDPYDYNAAAKLQFDELGFLNELAKSFGQDLGLGGKVYANWSGKGPLKDQTGTVELHADKLRTKSVEGIKLDATGGYQGMNAHIPTVRISSPYADLEASISFNSQALEIPTLSVRKSGNALEGNLKIPLNLRPGEKTFLGLDQPLEVNLRTNKINLASFQPEKPQVSGNLSFQLQASKTLRSPLIEFTASARDIKASAASSLSAAQGDLTVRLADKELAINGNLTQPDIHPLSVTGRMPIDIGQVVQSGTLPENTPIQLAVKWPANNLTFLRKIVPDIKIVEGTADVDVEATGTLKRPEVAGQIRTAISRFHAKTDTVPPISDFASTISFRQEQIQIDQLGGLVGGGRFSGTGSIDLKEGTNPKFDLSLKGKQVLLTRSDGIIVRANFDLAIRGPLSAGEVSGTVGITDSRFFKDVDILPLNLPGRPPPQPPPAAPPAISVTTPPFNAWKFNIAIKTDDAFLVQSNLARGRVTINLQAGGTGSAPSVTGDVIVNRLVASLPFSKMEIDNGRIDFVQGANILDPTLSIIGRSTVRDYEVTLRIFGNVSKPTVLLDSAPPLAQGDILVLLATGSTTSEFAQDPSLLAGRATFIVLEQLLGKFFPSTNRADEKKEPFIDRFSVNLIPGRKAGEQEISTSFRLTKNWEIIGNFGGGSYQGQLKYLVRFR